MLDPAREVIDIAGDDSVKWLEDQGPVILEERAALLEQGPAERVQSARPPTPGPHAGPMRAIEICRGTGR